MAVAVRRKGSQYFMCDRNQRMLVERRDLALSARLAVVGFGEGYRFIIL